MRKYALAAARARNLRPVAGRVICERKIQDVHEMSLAEGVLQLIEDAARRENFARVKTVWLEIGQLSSVEPEALAFCFDAVTRGSIAEGARLAFIEVAGSGWCLQCEKTVALAEQYAECPCCGGYRVQVTGGTEMRVKELEVEEE